MCLSRIKRNNCVSQNVDSYSRRVGIIFKYIHLSSPAEWNPQEINFPSYSLIERSKIESRNTSSLYQIKAFAFEKDSNNVLNDGVHSGIKDYNLDGFNCRLIASINLYVDRKIEKIQTGPLEEKDLKPPHTFLSSERHSSVTPEDISEWWYISVHQAKMTLNATTKKLVRSAIMPLSRRYRVDRMFGIRKLDYMSYLRIQWIGKFIQFMGIGMFRYSEVRNSLWPYIPWNLNLMLETNWTGLSEYMALQSF